MKLIFAGVGSAFASDEFYQTNAVFTNERDGKHLLIDCGSDARFSLPKIGVEPKDIERVYISHLHADHVGGLEWLGFITRFNPVLGRMKLHAASDILRNLWYSTLRGGMESLQGEVATLESYFDPIPLYPNDDFRWANAIFTPVQTIHIVSGHVFMHSYGLMIDLVGVVDMRRSDRIRKIYYTGDTQFAPKQIMDFYNEADLIFQDCETANFASNVHAHFHDLKSLPPEVKAKMWLVHYQADGCVTDEEAKQAGFLGFVKRGQEFEFV